MLNKASTLHRVPPGVGGRVPFAQTAGCAVAFTLLCWTGTCDGGGIPKITHGPFIGHTTPRSVSIWARCSHVGLYLATAAKVGSHKQVTAVARSKPENDHCVVWKLEGLQPDERYRYRLSFAGRVLFKGAEFHFTTPPSHDEPSTTRIAFGSCAAEDEGTAGVWRHMAAVEPDAVVLLGDTPYIDSTDLDVQRSRYAEFFSVAAMRSLLRATPFYATWDDHDFGRNDTNGRLPGKHNSRKAFVEYHANAFYGDSRHGIYTNFRRGGVEVFLLDTRYFAATEPSPFDCDKPTLLGKAQWDWLQKELKASSADFKVLACGMIWNEATRPNKRDHWMAYPHERAALFEFIGTNDIRGVVLVGGDIHRSRLLRHSTAGVAGYDIPELITSPMHHHIIEAANAPHPDLIYDSGDPNTFLLLTVDTTHDPPKLSGSFRNAAGHELFSIELSAPQLARHR